MDPKNKESASRIHSSDPTDPKRNPEWIPINHTSYSADPADPQKNPLRGFFNNLT